MLMALFKKEVKTEKKIDPVSEALEEVRIIVVKVKNNSFSDFENLKDRINRMLMQPESI